MTRPLSLYRDSSSGSGSDSGLPSGPNTGVLVIEDEGSERRWFFGLLKAKSVKVPPFPQNKLMKLWYSKGIHSDTDDFEAMLIPVLNQPSNSNQYYVISSDVIEKGYYSISHFLLALFLMISAPFFHYRKIKLINFRVSFFFQYIVYINEYCVCSSKLHQDIYGSEVV